MFSIAQSLSFISETGSIFFRNLLQSKINRFAIALFFLTIIAVKVNASTSLGPLTYSSNFIVNEDLGPVYESVVGSTSGEEKYTEEFKFKFPFIEFSSDGLNKFQISIDHKTYNKNSKPDSFVNYSEDKLDINFIGPILPVTSAVVNEIANNNKIYNSLILCTTGSVDPQCKHHWQDLNCLGCGTQSCEETPDGNLNGSQAICPSTGNPPSYEWQFRNASNNWVWENAPGVFWEDDYNPPSTSESTWYRRRTLCAGCDNWTETGEVVDVHVQTPLSSAGTINSDYCGTFPYTITTGQIQGMAPDNLTQFIEFQWRRNCDGGGWETITNQNFLDASDNSLISYTVTNNSMIGKTTCLYQKRLRVHGCDNWVTTPNITISNPNGCCTFPDVSNDSYSGCPGNNISGNVSSNDDSLTNPIYTLQSGGSASSNGSINVNSNGTFTYDPSGSPCGNYSFTYRVCNNNDSSCCSDATVSLSYADNTDPVLSGIPSNVTVQCNSIPSAASPSASDNCDSNVSITMNQTTSNSICTDSYTITRTWTATDNCGNTDVESQVITVRDTTDPVLSGIPSNVTVQCNSIPSAASPSASDNCDSNVSITMNQTTSNSTCTDSYTITRTWTATDNCGNTDVESQVITVRDTTDPVLSGIPSNVTVQCNAIPSAASPSASDNCDGNVSITMDQTTSNTICTDSYTITRTWTATDNCGNTDVESQVITVVDTTDPVLSSVPSDITAGCGSIPTAPTITASDNCDGRVEVTLDETTTPGACADIYTITRTWTATDNCGNEDVDSQEITVQEAPTPTGVDGQRCGPGVVNLSASSSSCVSCDEMRWYNSLSGGTVVNTGTTYAANISNTTNYYLVCYNSAIDCESAPRQEVTATINPVPTLMANATCSADGLTYSIMATTTDATGLMSDQGTVTGTAPNFMVSGILTGTNTVLVALNVTTSCNDTETVASPSCVCPAGSPSVMGAERCGPGSITLSATSGANCNEIRWYNTSTGGSVINTGTSYTTNITGTTSYFVACYNSANFCESDPRQQVVATMNEVPSYTAAASQGTCNGTTANNDAVINLSNVVGDEANIMLGTSYVPGPDYGNAGNTDVSAGTGSFTGLVHNTQYTLRVWNGADDCFVDETITTPSINCTPACTNPTYTTDTSQGTCNGTTANNDATINLSSLSNGDEANISAGSTYTGPAYGAGTNADVSGGSGTFTGLTHATVYTVRVWNGADDCFVDETVSTLSINCVITCPDDEDFSYDCAMGPGGCNVVIETYMVNIPQQADGSPQSPFVYTIPNNPTDGQFKVVARYRTRAGVGAEANGVDFNGTAGVVRWLTYGTNTMYVSNYETEITTGNLSTLTLDIDSGPVDDDNLPGLEILVFKCTQEATNAKYTGVYPDEFNWTDATGDIQNPRCINRTLCLAGGACAEARDITIQSGIFNIHQDRPECDPTGGREIVIEYTTDDGDVFTFLETPPENNSIVEHTISVSAAASAIEISVCTWKEDAADPDWMANCERGASHGWGFSVASDECACNSLITCTNPTASISPAQGTCTDDTANNDATINISSVLNGEEANISAGSTYTGPAYGAGTNVDVSGGSGTFTGLTHATVYTVRVWNGADDCFVDETITTPSITCVTSSCTDFPCYALHENPDFPLYKRESGNWSFVCDLNTAASEFDGLVVKGDTMFLFNRDEVYYFLSSSGNCNTTLLGAYGPNISKVEGASLDFLTGTIYIHGRDQICKMNSATGEAYDCVTIPTPANAPSGYEMTAWKAEDMALKPCDGTFYVSGAFSGSTTDHLISFDIETGTSNYIAAMSLVGGANGQGAGIDDGYADGLSFNACCELLSTDGKYNYLVDEATGEMTYLETITDDAVDFEAFDCVVNRPPVAENDSYSYSECTTFSCVTENIKSNDQNVDGKIADYQVTFTTIASGWTANVLNQELGTVEFCPPANVAEGTYVFEYEMCLTPECCSVPICSEAGRIEIELIDTCTSTCTTPTPTVMASQGTCTGATPNNDASISLSGVTNADEANISSGSSYTGPAYGDMSNTSVSGGSASFTGLAHSTQYTLRVWNGADDCFVDETITTPSINCEDPCSDPNCFNITPVRNN